MQTAYTIKADFALLCQLVAGGQQPKVIIEKENYIVAMRGCGMNNEQTLEPNTTGCTNALTTVQKDNLLLESAIIKMERTDEAKAIRKQYEAHEITARMSELRQPTLREDGLTNTITTVQKDNLLIEQTKCVGDLNDGKWGGASPPARPRIYGRHCASTSGDYP